MNGYSHGDLELSRTIISMIFLRVLVRFIDVVWRFMVDIYSPISPEPNLPQDRSLDVNYAAYRDSLDYGVHLDKPVRMYVNLVNRKW